MARLANDDARSVPSVLDRLLDDADGAPVHLRYGLSEMKQSVSRDLEALLNTRQEALDPLPGDFTESNRSLLTYGLPDFSALNLTSQADRNRVRRSLEEEIAVFEPRLDRVRVILDEPRPYDRGLHFRIEAVLQVQPAPEPVSFDAVLQLTTQEYRIGRS
jgi:type VI secretion system protein ImpF